MSVRLTGQILLIGEYEYGNARIVGTAGRPGQFHFGLLEALRVARVDDEDDAVGAARVRFPKRAQLLLSAHVPYQEIHAYEREKDIKYREG